MQRPCRVASNASGLLSAVVCRYEGYAVRADQITHWKECSATQIQLAHISRNRRCATRSGYAR
ncbi:MAG: hypothetical protein QOF74_7234 [Caballeronia mineralivorans]|nr:hypothetical protein [Caballeronia mineralivorans]